MKVVFVEHPCPVLLLGDQPWSPIRTNTYPQSQMTLAAAVANEHDVEILDLRSLPSPNDWRQQIGAKYLTPVRYGESTLTRHLIGNYRAQIASHPADVFVFTANFTAEANAVAEAIRTTKKLWPEAIILVGGRDASAEERHAFYFNSGANYIGLGDGDVALPRFLTQVAAGHRPDSRFIDGGISHGFHAALPNLNLSGVQKQRYVESGGGPIMPSVLSRGGFAAYVETSRGCPRECDFCTEAKSPRWAMSVDEVLHHIDHMIDNGCKLFMVSDDNLLIRSTPELVAIFSHLRERNVAWEFPVGLEVGLLTDVEGRFREELFEALFWNTKDPANFAGVHRLLVPMEDALLHKSNLIKLKRIQSHIGELLRRLVDTGIPFLNLAIMIGGVQETPADRERLGGQLEMIYGLTRGSTTRVNFSIFCTSPLPGTPFGRLMTAQKRLSHSIEEAPELWTVFASVINGENFTAEQTTNYRRELLQRFHMSQDEGKIDPNP